MKRYDTSFMVNNSSKYKQKARFTIDLDSDNEIPLQELGSIQKK